MWPRIKIFIITYIFVHASSFQPTRLLPTKRISVVNRHVGISHPTPDFPPAGIKLEEKRKPTKKATTRLSAMESLWTKYGMIAYVAHMCAFLPIALFPTFLQARLNLLSKLEKECQALQVGQVTARILMQWIPFINLNIVPVPNINEMGEEPKPTIWVCNHVSMLDTFVLLASDRELRGKNRRQIKTIYWKGLDANPIVKLLFTMAGFISVDMADNGNGHPNEYNRASFKKMLKETQQAIDDGFDLLVLPEGQLNPTPEKGLQPILPGAYALSKSSCRPIQMVALYGCHQLWHADESIGMTVVGRDVSVRGYPPGREYSSPGEFKDAFSAIVGTYGSTGQDLPEEDLKFWLDDTEN